MLAKTGDSRHAPAALAFIATRLMMIIIIISSGNDHDLRVWASVTATATTNGNGNRQEWQQPATAGMAVKAKKETIRQSTI